MPKALRVQLRDMLRFWLGSENVWMVDDDKIHITWYGRQYRINVDRIK